VLSVDVRRHSSWLLAYVAMLEIFMGRLAPIYFMNLECAFWYMHLELLGTSGWMFDQPMIQVEYSEVLRLDHDL